MTIGEKGLLGEWRAARYVKRQGMKLLEKRYRTAHGEIDLITRDGDITVMIEVKYRPRGKIGDGLMAVNGKKRDHLRYAAAHYLRSHPGAILRFDVIEISAAGIRHIKNAL